jgi:iron uptake system EfeUOB component EfeO/EfeM
MQKQINPEDDWEETREKAIQALGQMVKAYHSFPDEGRLELLITMRKLTEAIADGDAQVRFADLLRRLVREEEEGKKR